MEALLCYVGVGGFVSGSLERNCVSFLKHTYYLKHLLHEFWSSKNQGQLEADGALVVRYCTRGYQSIPPSH